MTNVINILNKRVIVIPLFYLFWLTMTRLNDLTGRFNFISKGYTMSRDISLRINLITIRRFNRLILFINWYFIVEINNLLSPPFYWEQF